MISPRPWKFVGGINQIVDSDGFAVANLVREMFGKGHLEDNAQFIVDAVNSYVEGEKENG